MNPSYFCRPRHARSFFVLWMVLFAFLAGASAFAQTEDQIGIYFDPAYTQNQITAGALPALVPAYVVLNNPSAPEGVAGWEFRFKIDGPGSLAGTEFVGAAINVGTPPDFIVGIGDAPLPGGDQVLLATFNILVDGTDPVILSLLPLYTASLPGEMAYLTAGESAELLPMTTVTGNPMVAYISAVHTAVCELTPDFVSFPEVAVGGQETRFFTIENVGITPMFLDIAFAGECPTFALVNISEGPLTIEPMASQTVSVAFSPTDLGYQECLLQLGGECPDITVYGTGREPITSWSAPTVVNFGEILVGSSKLQTFNVYNTGEADFTIQTVMDASCDVFSVNMGFNGTLEVGAIGYITLDFQPTTAGAFTCTLDMGETVPPIEVTGTAREPITSVIGPEFLDFGEVDFGESATLPLSITNTGDVDVELDYSLGTGCEAFALSQTGLYLLQAGLSHTIDVTFSPIAIGETTCLLELGEFITPIPLIGTCLTEVTEFLVTPAVLDFPMTGVGYTRTLNVVFYNTGSTVIPIEPALTPMAGVFSIESGDVAGDLTPGSSHTVAIAFAPLAAGSFTADLSFGVDLPVVPITGTSEEPVLGCNIYPTEMDFGSVTVGGYGTGSFQVTNTGNVPLVINPTDNSTAFSVQPGPFSIEPGYTKSVLVTFRPPDEGPWGAVISMGEDVCSTVNCIGNGTVPPGWNENLVGITFYPGSLNYNYFDFSTFAATGSLVTAYLAMINPSSHDPLAGWELCVDLEGPGIFASWEIPGSPINVLTEPCFMVGLGEPMPPAPYYILATAQILVVSSEEEIFLSLEPVYHASIPGEMAWLTGGAVPHLIPMKTSYTGYDVAVINSYDPLGVGAPTPTAELTGGMVELSWTLPPGEDAEVDGCRVYRGVQPGSAEPVSQQLSPVTGRTFTFTDDPTGFAPGTVLYYSYALVRNGVEQARSAEVEVTLKSLPPTVTRLLPNVPNPFNPQTEIRFELEKAGPARVTIYDVTGRLVRTLVSEGLDAGPHSRTWFGKDDHGRQAPSGAYYIRLETEGRTATHKAMLLK